MKKQFVEIDPDVVLREMRSRHWNSDDLVKKTDLSAGTVSALLQGKHPSYWSTAIVLQKVFGFDSVDRLIKKPDSGNSTPDDWVQEWQKADSLSDWVTTSNKLQYRIWKLKHRHLSKVARGKCYELDGMASRDRDSCQAWLLRHAEVCSRIGEHPNIIRNITTFEDMPRHHWWIVDEWVDGETLSNFLRQTKLDTQQALDCSVQIAIALNTLHAQKIVRRELCPDSIIFQPAFNRIVLTEFELAKLHDGSPTVSTESWPSDDYRAPEASSSDVDMRADIYSWSKITIELLLGKLPPDGREFGALQKTKLAKPLSKLLLDCISISRRSRPSSFDEILGQLTSFQSKVSKVPS